IVTGVQTCALPICDRGTSATTCRSRNRAERLKSRGSSLRVARQYEETEGGNDQPCAKQFFYRSVDPFPPGLGRAHRPRGQQPAQRENYHPRTLMNWLHGYVPPKIFMNFL